MIKDIGSVFRFKLDHLPFTRSVKQVMINRAKAAYVAKSDWSLCGDRWRLVFWFDVHYDLVGVFVACKSAVIVI